MMWSPWVRRTRRYCRI